MLGFLLLLCSISFSVPALAAESGVASDAELEVSGELRVGQPVTAAFDLKGYRISTGAYASINVRFEQKPDGIDPKVKTGYPKTILFFNTPGAYRITFILNEVSKPSCGGVNAKPLLEKTIELLISE
ncbi:hypothetical protein GM415_10110 [Pseudodesulfovibrio cashew]|uniref:Uncharacterized protein n=1 Tax=Pseudodesulfovibrio cashew TaxID=2678688 RepID=A0A6I6JSD6_9BACT|nr:hypothetical protein [Pseudodesulfovibrio cashew]QGY40464.1 hypothetical protein GM415_10110 [Pseudodesulfovibrio cashew]